jgi:hypothetical protein
MPNLSFQQPRINPGASSNKADTDYWSRLPEMSLFFNFLNLKIDRPGTIGTTGDNGIATLGPHIKAPVGVIPNQYFIDIIPCPRTKPLRHTGSGIHKEGLSHSKNFTGA